MYKIKFLNGIEEEFVSLRRANLRGVDLRGVDLRGVDLRGVDLSGADLRGAGLSGADLRGVDLRGVDLSEVNLSKANLSWANLSEANLSEANLSEANLSEANLSEANLSKARLPIYKILPEEGSFIGWKKTTKGVIKLLIMEDSIRVSTLIGRKCRASKIQVIDGPGCGGTGPVQRGITYNKGAIIETEIDTDIRVECTKGIHFFLTREEAEKF
jgi:Family of unknown function (DUF5758)/Pentapeptide repeats (8 copies)